MTRLIACLSTGKGTWSHVSRLINEESWDNVFLITNSFGKENFTSSEKPVEFMEIDQNKPLIELRDDIKTQRKRKNIYLLLRLYFWSAGTAYSANE